MSSKTLVVIKLGALGDVVRTSYIVRSYAKLNGFDEIYWITKPNAFNLLKGIPGIIVVGNDDVPNIVASMVLSLDDEMEAVRLLDKISYEKLIGAFIDNLGLIQYTPNSAAWFDMGLISRYGKDQADEFKRANTRSHTEIFSQILELDIVEPFFFGNEGLETIWQSKRSQFDFVVGLNIFAGSRWPSKELPSEELSILICQIEVFLKKYFINPCVIIFSDSSNESRTIEILNNHSSVIIWKTGKDILEFAAAVRACNYIISTDSLGLHLAIAQQVPNLSYYAPTSAAEIDTFGSGVKVLSTAFDYCSYSPKADNSSLTSDRILMEWTQHMHKLGLLNG